MRVRLVKETGRKWGVRTSRVRGHIWFGFAANLRIPEVKAILFGCCIHFGQIRIREIIERNDGTDPLDEMGAGETLIEYQVTSK